MRLAIIGSSGHYPVVLEGLSEQEEMTICAIAPGCREEDITPLAEACAENGHAPAVWEDWKEMLSAEQPSLAVINSCLGKRQIGLLVFVPRNSRICGKASRRKPRGACPGAPGMGRNSLPFRSDVDSAV